MDIVNTILVLNRQHTDCIKAFHCGVSLAKKFEADLLIVHLPSTPTVLGVVDVPWVIPEGLNQVSIQSEQDELEIMKKLIKTENLRGVRIKEIVCNSDSFKSIAKIVNEEDIDLIIMPSNKEGLIEHALFGGENSELIRKMPCSILLVKNESENEIGNSEERVYV